MFLFLPCPSLSSLLLSLLSLLSLSLGDDKMTHKGWHVVKPQHNQKHTSQINESQSSQPPVSSLSLMFLFLPCPSLSSLLLSLLSLLSLSLGDDKMTHKGWHVVKPQQNQINESQSSHPPPPPPPPPPPHTHTHTHTPPLTQRDDHN